MAETGKELELYKISNQIVDIHRLDVINYNLKYMSNKNNNTNKSVGSFLEKLFGKWSD